MKINAATLDNAKYRYIALKDILGKNMAKFVCCAYCDLPYIEDVKAEDFDVYARAIGSAKQFKDGITDYNAVEESSKTREERWQSEWGFGPDNSKYTESDYIRLDELFKSYSSRLVAAGGYDKLQEDTLRHCCRLALERDKCVSKGGKENVDMAAKLDKMIQDNLGSENLRKKDAKPVDEAKVDAITVVAQKKFGAGLDMTKDQFFAGFYKWLKSHRYPVTSDAVEHVIECIINATRRNNDEPEMTEFPAKFRVSENNAELDPAPSKEEDAVYKYLNVERRH